MATLSRYYQILGLPKQAKPEEIKKAFRELALRWHPDRNPGDPAASARFRNILEAYENLLDHFRKKDGRRRRSEPRARRQEEGVWTSETDASKEPRDIFEEYFGFDLKHRDNGGGRQYDLRFDLQVSRKAMIEGGYESIDYQRMVFCRQCRGPMPEQRSSSATCSGCQGTGEVEEQRSIRVWIPPGSQHGTRLRIPCGGDQLEPGDPAGDLVILLHLGM
jgi:molecular chaperone DnaJ